MREANQSLNLVLIEKQLDNDNGGDINNKLSTDIKSLVAEKIINEKSNASIHEQEKAKWQALQSKNQYQAMFIANLGSY